MRASDRCTGGAGDPAFTLVELVVVIGVIGILAALLSSAWHETKARAVSIQCVANLRQWGVALNLYANDHDGAYPRRGQGVQPLFQIDRPEDWFNALPPYVGEIPLQEALQAGRAPKRGDHSIFLCPAALPNAAGPYFLPYAMNMYLSPWIRPQPHTRQQIQNPAQLAFLADGPVAWSSTVPSREGYSVQARHSGFANVCFVDGHVASFAGDYMGCKQGEPSPPCPEIHWQTDTAGVNQARVP